MMAPRDGKTIMNMSHAALAHPERSSRLMTSPKRPMKIQMAITQKNMTSIHQKTSRNVVFATTISPPLRLGEARAHPQEHGPSQGGFSAGAAVGSSPGDRVHPGERRPRLSVSCPAA